MNQKNYKNSDEIKETFNYDSRNDSKLYQKNQRGPKVKEYFKRRRSISKESLNDDLDEFNEINSKIN